MPGEREWTGLDVVCGWWKSECLFKKLNSLYAKVHADVSHTLPLSTKNRWAEKHTARHIEEYMQYFGESFPCIQIIQKQHILHATAGTSRNTGALGWGSWENRGVGVGVGRRPTQL
jgi:hypothetical protein